MIGSGTTQPPTPLVLLPGREPNPTPATRLAPPGNGTKQILITLPLPAGRGRARPQRTHRSTVHTFPLGNARTPMRTASPIRIGKLEALPRSSVFFLGIAHRPQSPPQPPPFPTVSPGFIELVLSNYHLSSVLSLIHSLSLLLPLVPPEAQAKCKPIHSCSWSTLGFFARTQYSIPSNVSLDIFTTASVSCHAGEVRRGDEKNNNRVANKLREAQLVGKWKWTGLSLLSHRESMRSHSRRLHPRPGHACMTDDALGSTSLPSLDLVVFSRFYPRPRLSIMAAIARVYQDSFTKRPSATLAATNGALNAFADVVAQTAQIFMTTPDKAPHKPEFEPPPPRYDPARTLRFFAFGTVMGPLIGRWNVFLENRFPLRSIGGKVSMAALGKRVAADQIVMAPIGLTMFVGMMGWMEGRNLQGIKQKYSDMYAPALAANYKVWPAAQLVNFRYMPLPYRVPFQATCGVFWTLYLSLLNAREKKVDGPV
ncbi:Protein sym1 OS=Schizosaccharomyces pombe (strain 972 / ATCC 24843) GN=sym1 PE=3 SV=1 [Rhizoctonia solani AG-1 IB]|uniref:Protein sym1 n=2 Tax=Rhizoctonia solani TaxID=456999 RepID=A0A0B7FN07_THACB|nr:Protein sym1 OS=Schizosaccharomyces pombe (strain 972 / ATCC 24843) GN=sym1 PE=3 SV=1 [Rhizoctonia solani AG-1 IB]